MHRFLTSLMALAIGVGVIASTAHAQFNVPFKGKQYKGNLMIGYAPCTAPDTVTDYAQPACSSAVRTDTGCGYGGGQGKIQIKGQTVGNYDARLKITSLDAACEGCRAHGRNVCSPNSRVRGSWPVGVLDGEREARAVGGEHHVTHGSQVVEIHDLDVRPRRSWRRRGRRGGRCGAGHCRRGWSRRLVGTVAVTPSEADTDRH